MFDLFIQVDNYVSVFFFFNNYVNVTIIFHIQIFFLEVDNFFQFKKKCNNSLTSICFNFDKIQECKVYIGGAGKA